MGCEYTRSAIRTGSPMDPLRYPDPNGPDPRLLDSQQLRLLGRTVAMVRNNLSLSLSSEASFCVSAKFVLKEGSKNSTDSFIELLSESGTSEEEYSSTFLRLLQWVLLQSKGKYSPEICLCHAASTIL